MKLPFNSVAADIRINNGWKIKKIEYREGSPIVTLYCALEDKNYKQEVRMDLDKGIFVGYLFYPFTRDPQKELAAEIKKLITPPKA